MPVGDRDVSTPLKASRSLGIGSGSSDVSNLEPS